MPGRAVAFRTAMAAKPTPPAAPAPATSAAGCPESPSGTPRARATAPDQTRSAPSSRATSSGVAPFCGPYTAAAPRSPSSGLSTSLASTTSAPARPGCRPDRSTRSTCSSPPPPAGTGSPRGVEDPGAERGQHAGAAVGAGAAADGQHQPPAAGVQGGRDDLPEAGAGRGQRGEHPAGQPDQAAGVGQFDHRRVVLAGVAGVHRLAGRPVDGDRDQGESGGDRGVQGAVPAVGDGDE